MSYQILLLSTCLLASIGLFAQKKVDTIISIDTAEAYRVSILKNNDTVGLSIKRGDTLEEQSIFIVQNGEPLYMEDMDVMIEQSEGTLRPHNIHILQLEENEGVPTAFLGVWPGGEDDEGVSIGGVVEKSAAQKAGLQPGDVITALDGIAVRTFSELSTAIKAHQVGDVVQIDFTRAGKKQLIKVTLGQQKQKECRSKKWLNYKDMPHNKNEWDEWYAKAYAARHRAECCKEVEKARIGIMIQNAENGGAAIHKVMRGDDLLQGGDVIVQFGRTPIQDINELIAAVNLRSPGERVRLRLLRDGKKMKQKVTLKGIMVEVCCEKNGKCCEEEELKKQTPPSTDAAVKSDFGASQLELQDFQLFPNPTKGQFSMTFSTATSTDLNIVVRDVTGRDIINDTIRDFSGIYQGVFNLADYGAGVYFMNIIQDGKVLVEKVVIE